LRSFSFAILTVSDRGSRGEREDSSGPEIEAMLLHLEGRRVDYRVVPDEVPAIQSVIREWSDQQGVDLIVTTGGTGVHPRDVTPDATRPLLDREIPGMGEAMRASSSHKTPHAMLSRCLAGIRGKSLIVNLPGSPRGARENLQVLAPALSHAMEKIQGDPSECASP
jgi:molybdopterin adenylyltransferase